jgi:hypothetical protein
MGGGSWTYTSAVNYVSSKYDAFNVKSMDDIAHLNVHQVYDSYQLVPELDPKGVIRECRDSEEHPNTFPIILALDVTGSMGSAARNCAAKLNDIMTNLYAKVTDVEFLMMGIGDLSYDQAPIQATQFESDVRILDQTTKIYFEGGGGGNSFESYTAAWYFGLHHTDLDCWKRGKKGIIITMGDEPLNPYLPGKRLYTVLDGNRQSDLKDVDTEGLYKEALEKFDIYHIAITDNEGSYKYYADEIDRTWGKLLSQRLLKAKSEDLPDVIGQIVEDSTGIVSNVTATISGGISW